MESVNPVDSNVSPRRAGRKPKFTPEELEQRMLKAAIADVLAAGVSYGVDSVRLDRIIVSTDVPRGAAYSYWEGEGRSAQEGLRRQTVLTILRDTPSGNASATEAVALQEIALHADALASADADLIRAALSKVIPVVAKFNFDGLQSQMWKIYRSLVSTVTTQIDDDPEVLQAVRDGEAALIEAYSTRFTGFMDLFSLEFRDGFTMKQFSMCVYALNDGLANRSAPAFEDQTLKIETSDAYEEWTLFAVGFEALVDRFFQHRAR